MRKLPGKTILSAQNIHCSLISFITAGGSANAFFCEQKEQTNLPLILLIPELGLLYMLLDNSSSDPL